MNDDQSRENSADSDGAVPITDLVAALATKRRRFVLYSLRKRDRVTFDELTEQIVGWETGGEGLDEQRRKNVEIDLAHAHLPVLEDLGVLEFDRRRNVVQYESLPGFVERFLDYCAAIEVSE